MCPFFLNNSLSFSTAQFRLASSKQITPNINNKQNNKLRLREKYLIFYSICIIQSLSWGSWTRITKNTPQRSKMAAISAYVLPFVSGINVMMKTAPQIVQPAKKNTQPCMPISAATASKNFTITNANIHDKQKQMVQPMLRTWVLFSELRNLWSF